jgi:NADH-quinone oxidoreductase subunit A
MSYLIVVPPIALTILVLVVWGLSRASGTLAFKRKSDRGAIDKPYAGGETIDTHRVRVDYAQFFPFAFFFTLLHVATLMVATAPGHSLQSMATAVIYVLGALLGLFILLRR